MASVITLAAPAVAESPVLVEIVDTNPAARHKVTVYRVSKDGSTDPDEISRMAFCPTGGTNCKFKKVDVTLSMDENGRVAACSIKKSNDYEILEPVVCPIAFSNFRSVPSFTEGKAEDATLVRRFRFLVPDTTVPIAALAVESLSNSQRPCGENNSDCKISVVADYLIGKDGAPKDCIVVRPDVQRPLNDAVCKIVLELFRYTPATLNNVPVALRRQQRFTFKMQGDDPFRSGVSQLEPVE